MTVKTLARGASPADPAARLRMLEGLARQADAADITRQARELAGRVAEGRFYLACVGQFKRGKSTLLNALVGRALLPTGVAPVTSAVTVLRHGAETAARVWFQDGHALEIPPEEIGAYVSESENPENRKGVRAVEVFVPSPLLAGGMCLVDTPGLGSVFGGNAAVTRAFVPHVDAALVVIGADPPLSGDELRLVEEVSAQVRNVIFVLNKADRLTAREREEGTRFAMQILSQRLRRSVGAIHEVSAKERIESGAPTRDWGALERAVAALGREAGDDLVRAAEARGVDRLARALLRELAERCDALLRPAEASERRIAGLERSVAAAERATEDLGALLGAEQARLARDFRARQEAYYPGARDEALRELAGRIRSLAEPRYRLRAASYRLAQEVSREAVERWRAEIDVAAEELYRRSMERFVSLANEFLSRLAASGEPGLDGLRPELAPEAGFRAQSGLRYTELLNLTTNMASWPLDLVRPRRMTLRALGRRVGRYLEDILEANSSRVANDLVERTVESRARLEREVRGVLRQVVDVARQALARARDRRAEGEEAVRAELGLLESLRSETESLLHARDEGERT